MFKTSSVEEIAGSGGILFLMHFIVFETDVRPRYHTINKSDPHRKPTTTNTTKNVFTRSYLKEAVNNASVELKAIEIEKIPKLKQTLVGGPFSRRSSSLSFIS